MTEAFDKVKDTVSEHFDHDSVKDYFKSDDFKKVLPYLLSGGGAAALGGLASGRRRKEEGEGRVGYLGRILRNAALSGAAGAGAYGLARYGMDQVTEGMSTDPAGTGEPQRGAAEQITRNLMTHPAAMGAGGVAGYTLKNKGRNPKNLADETKAFKDSLLSKLQRDNKAIRAENKLRSATQVPQVEKAIPDWLKKDVNMQASLRRSGGSKEIDDVMKSLPKGEQRQLDQLRRRARLARGSGLRGAGSVIANKLGGTWAGRGARLGAIGAGAAALPLLGEALTD